MDITKRDPKGILSPEADQAGCFMVRHLFPVLRHFFDWQSNDSTIPLCYAERKEAVRRPYGYRKKNGRIHPGIIGLFLF